jgi:acetyl esterase
MPLDPDAAQLIALMEGAMPGGMHTVPVDDVRATMAAMAKSAPTGKPVERVEDRTVPGPNGPVPVRIYWPTAETNLPALIWIHGGAFAFGGLDGADATSRELAHGANTVVVSVDYRLAPENPFPAGLHDCYAVLEWLSENALEIGVDAGRIAVGGDSAGGTLSAALTLMTRDQSGPPLAFQILAYPTVLMRVSSYEHVGGPLVGHSMATHFWTAYVNTDDDLSNPYCAPLNASSFEGLPPAFIAVPEVDSTRADQELYAQKLASAGVLTTYKVYPGAPHGFFDWFGALAKGRQAMDDAIIALRSALAVAQ